MTPTMVALLLACGSDPGMPVVRLEDGMVSLQGVQLAGLRDRGMLRQSRHRLLVDGLKDLSLGIRPQDGVKADPKDRRERLKSTMGSEPPPDPFTPEGRSVRLEVDPEAPFSDLHVLLVSCAWAGYGRVHLALVGDKEAAVGPLALDVREDPVWQGEPVVGVSSVIVLGLSPRDLTAKIDVRIRVSSDPAPRRHLDPVAAPVAPLVDCTALFAGDVRLAEVCREGQRTDGASFAGPGEWPPGAGRDGWIALGNAGCVAAADSGTWIPPVGAFLADLGVTRQDRIVLAPYADLPVESLVEAMGAFPAAGLDLPFLPATPPAGTSDDPRTAPPPPTPPPCVPGPVAPRVLEEAGARWLGERHRTPMETP